MSLMSQYVFAQQEHADPDAPENNEPICEGCEHDPQPCPTQPCELTEIGQPL